MKASELIDRLKKVVDVFGDADIKCYPPKCYPPMEGDYFYPDTVSAVIDCDGVVEAHLS